MAARWEHFSHDADIGVRGRGATEAEAFAGAAVALTAVVTDPARVRPASRIHVACEAPGLEMLLYDWLNAVIYEMDTRRMLFSRFEVSIEDGRLEATISGEEIDPARHEPAVGVKGATLTELKVAREGEGWIAQCVVDV